MHKPTFALLAVTAVLVGCVSLAPEAARVTVARDSADVSGCRILGSVRAHPPYVGPDDAMNQLKNEVAGLGGNVLFVTTMAVTATGMAYHCGG